MSLYDLRMQLGIKDEDLICPIFAEDNLSKSYKEMEYECLKERCSAWDKEKKECKLSRYSSNP